MRRSVITAAGSPGCDSHAERWALFTEHALCVPSPVVPEGHGCGDVEMWPQQGHHAAYTTLLSCM